MLPTRILLILCPDLEIHSPQLQFCRSHSFPELRQGHVQLQGQTHLKPQVSVLAEALGERTGGKSGTVTPSSSAVSLPA